MDTATPKTHNINGTVWTETERHELTLNDGQVRTGIHIKRSKGHNKETIYAYVIQDSGETMAKMSLWRPRTFKIPALSL